MPDLTEQMYCSQQICIPPAFPYLLRQFCKAAIRTQPNDLLRWAVAYWRCLSLNIPPPVKPRLEYPIPQCRIGVSPGWLKAFLAQLQGAVTISFPILWDRWMGAGLDHDPLIEVLVLGRFTDPYNIPWFRFVGLCAGYFSRNLTKTMILVCEILTEEPEGGSAMISVDVFLDVYTYLASIEAGIDQTLKNIYFTDDLLDLYMDEKKRLEKRFGTTPTVSSEEGLTEGEEEETTSKGIGEGESDLSKGISCPDLLSDEIRAEEEEKLEDLEMIQKQEKKRADMFSIYGSQLEGEMGEEGEEEQEEEEKATEEEEVEVDEEFILLFEEDIQAKPEEGKEEETAEVETKSSVSTVTGEDSMPVRQRDIDAAEAETVRLKALEESELAVEEYGEDKERDWEELAKLKERLDARELEEGQAVSAEEICKTSSLGEEEIPGELEKVYQDIFIEAVPGIGPVVPCEIVNPVIEYFKNVAVKQHGMAMPRNIKHFLCPPLEVPESY